MEKEGIPMYQDYPEFEVLDQLEDEFADPEFYVDQFYRQREFLDADGGGGLAPFSLSEILQHCIEPTVTDGFKHMSKILVWSLVFRISTQLLDVSAWMRHASSIVCGTVLASHFFGAGVFYLLGLVTLSYAALAVSPGIRGSVVAALVVSYNIGCETWIADAISWHQVRGAMMICAMKVISVGFDMDSAAAAIAAASGKSDTEEEAINTGGRGELRGRTVRKTAKSSNSSAAKNGGGSNKDDPQSSEGANAEMDLAVMPGWFEFAGYCLCPGTVVLGPWTPYSQYKSIFINPRWNLNWLLKISFTMFFSFMFLTISTCWNPWLIPDSGWKWWLAYRDAMSFRASHYFISFMSEASAIAAGFGASQNGMSTLWQLPVTQPHNIEVPRSLVEVVVSWNMPMHGWLKKYVFRETRKSLGPGCAIVATYVASTLLHGLSAQLAAVLLSLGLYTWVEHNIRAKLANIMDASIESRRDLEGKRKNREGKAWVIVVNLLFGMLAMFHLAYLGVMFDQSGESPAGYSWRHTLAKWRRLDFTSHWVVAGMLLINWLL